MAASGIALATMMGLVACSSGGSEDADGSESGSTTAVPATSGAGQTITVWAMNGDLKDETIAAINAEFTKQTGAEVKVETQPWADIATKITTALSTSTPPDVLDLGNTQVATFAANGGLLDLTEYKDDLAQGQTWLAGLVDPATIDGSLYGVPSFGGARAVIYNKDVWSAAGITTPPTTYDELTADLDKIKAANSSTDFSALYLPGQYWYSGIQWIWDAGGDLATASGDKWTSGFGSSESQKGLDEWKEFQNTYSSEASRTLNTDEPDQDQLFADGKSSAVIGNSNDVAQIIKANAALKDSVATFAMPGSSGSDQPVMLAGSDWGIAAKSQNQELALQWVKIAASPDMQNTYIYGNDGWVPNSTEGIDKATASSTMTDVNKSFFEAAKNSKATPASAGWAQLEDPGIKQFFQSIASGSKSVADATSQWDSTVNEALNNG